MSSEYPDYEFRKCLRCGVKDQMLPTDIWCRECLGKFGAEYLPVHQQHMQTHGALYLDAMGVPKRFQDCSFESFRTSSQELERGLATVRKWTSTLEPPGLYLCGAVGVGKTHLAVGAMRSLRSRSPHGKFKFVSVQALVQKLRESFSTDSESVSEIIRRLTSTKLLVLDDLGAGKATDFVAGEMLSLVDCLYGECRTALIVTSNLDLNALSEKWDPRMVDRLLEMCLCVRMNGSSYRQQIAQVQARSF